MTERNRFIDISKGIAIILVLFNHYVWDKTSVFNTHLYYWIISMAEPIFMLCTGYVTALSFDVKKVAVRESYLPEKLCPKLLRYIMPVFWFYVLETVLTFVFQRIGYVEYLSGLGVVFSDAYEEKLTVFGIIKCFFEGGRGLHGTYYFPIILQVTFIIPFICMIVKKYEWGVYLCFIINLVFEILKNPMGMTSGVYRIIALRYIFSISLGCYLYIYREKYGKWYKWIIFFLLGMLYTYVVSYTSYERQIFTYRFRNNMISMLYITPPFLLGIKYLGKIRCAILETLGKASYHILMVQILYYNFLAPLLWKASDNKIISDFTGMCISLIICLGGGCGYYILYNFISKKYAKRKFIKRSAI